MKDFVGVAPFRRTAPTVDTLQRPPTCQVGNVFILSKETNGAFKQSFSGWGRHITLLAGGHSRVCAAIESARSRVRKGLETNHITKIPAFSNNVQQIEVRDDTRQQEWETYSFATPDSTAAQRLQHGEFCCLCSQRKCCSDVSATTHTETQSGEAGHIQPRGDSISVDRRGCFHTSEDTRRGAAPTQTLLFIESSRIEPLSQVCFHQLLQDSLPPCPDQTKSSLHSRSCPPHFVQISVGKTHTLLCDDAGSLYSLEDSCPAPRGERRRRLCNLQPILALQNQKVVRTCAGDHYSLAVTDTGDVYSWGAAYSGQLGRVPEEVALAPRFVASLMRTFIAGLSCNESHVLAYSQNGECFAWGSNDCGQLGLGLRSPPQAHPQRVYMKAKYGTHLRVVGGLDVTGTAPEAPRMLYTRSALPERGRSIDFALANCVLQERRCRSSEAQRSRRFCVEHRKAEAENSLSTDGVACDKPRDILVFVVAVAAGWRHSLALTASGHVYSWGLNVAGQLGLGHSQACYAPVCIVEYENGLQAPSNRMGLLDDRQAKGQSSRLPDCMGEETAEYVYSAHSKNMVSTCDGFGMNNHLRQSTVPGRWDVTQGSSPANVDSAGHAHRGLTSDSELCSRSQISTRTHRHCAAEVGKGLYAAQWKAFGRQNAQSDISVNVSDVRVTQRSELRRNLDGAVRARSASVSGSTWLYTERIKQDTCVLDSLDTCLRRQVTVSQVCAGQLFSAFLSTEGRVFLSGQTPDAKQCAACARPLDRTLCTCGHETRRAPGNLIPATVPGLKDVIITEIACSNNALAAFVPCQVLRVQPSLVPLPSPGGPPINLRLTITVFPQALPSSTCGTPEENSNWQGASADGFHDGRNQHAEPFEGNEKAFEHHRVCSCLRSQCPAIVSNGHKAEPVSTPPCSAEENDANPGTGKLRGQQLTKTSEAVDVLVRFRSLARGLASGRKHLSSCTVVQGSFGRRIVDELMPAAEIHCRCPTLVHSGSGSALSPGVSSDLPQTRRKASPTRGEAIVFPLQDVCSFSAETSTREPENAAVVGRGVSQDMFLPDASYFQPETSREEECINAYYKAKRCLDSQDPQVLPYALEVSVDGGCCWSSAAFNRTAATVLFARFPEAIIAVYPNNLTVKGGLTLSILLDSIPSGIPEDDIVVKFTCIQRYQGVTFSNRCPSPPDEHQFSPEPSAAADAEVTSEPSFAHSTRDAEKDGDGGAEQHMSEEGSDGGRPLTQRSESGTASAEGGKTLVGGNVDSEASLQSWRDCQQVAKNSAASAGVGSATRSFSCGSPALTCNAGDEDQDFSYFVLVPARIVKRGLNKEGPQCAATQELALQCSSPAFDGSNATDFDVFVDVALNGENFTEKPIRLRVLEPEILELSPTVGYSGSETKVYIRAREHCDSTETAVLLKYDDGFQQIVPGCIEPGTRQLYFIMPERRLPTPPSAASLQDALENPQGSTDIGASLDKPPDEGMTRTDCASDTASCPSPKCSRTGAALDVNRNIAELHSSPVSVHLSFNGQVFSCSAKTFLHYHSELVVVGMLGYTISEGGDLLEADLENVIAPGTTLVIFLQWAVATRSAHVRLTVLKSDVARSSPRCSPRTSSVADTESYASQQDAKSTPLHEAERVILLPAALEMEPQRLVLLSDHGRNKKKHPTQRGAFSDGGAKGKPQAGQAAGHTGAGNAGVTAVSKKSAGGATNSAAGGAPVDSSAVPSRVKSKGAAASAGVSSTGAVSGAPAAPNKMSSKRNEKNNDHISHSDVEDEKASGPTLMVTIPNLTLDSQVADTSATDGVVYAVGEVSLDGQHFVPLKQGSVLRLQCTRSRAEADVSRPTSSNKTRSSPGKGA